MVETFLICATVVLVGWRAELLLKQLFKISNDKLDASGLKTPDKGEPVPHHLLMLALSESEPWAREDALKRYQQLYGQLGDWNKVQAVVDPNATGS